MYREKYIIEKKSTIHWHINNLQQYLLEGITPFRLRIQIFPHFLKTSLDLKKNWEDTLNNCSLNLIKLLIEEHKKEIDCLDTELEYLWKGVAGIQCIEQF